MINCINSTYMILIVNIFFTSFFMDPLDTPDHISIRKYYGEHFLDNEWYEPSKYLRETEIYVFELKQTTNFQRSVKTFILSYLLKVYQMTLKKILVVQCDKSKYYRAFDRGLRLVWGLLYRNEVVNHKRPTQYDRKRLFGVLCLMRNHFPYFWAWGLRWIRSYRLSRGYHYSIVEIFNRVCAWLVRID